MKVPAGEEENVACVLESFRLLDLPKQHHEIHPWMEFQEMGTLRT